jgi:hypothetical protein
MSSEWTSLCSPKVFLQSLYCKAVDFNLISQVEFWKISKKVFETFGADIERRPGRDIAESTMFLNGAYDQWLKDWTDVVSMRNNDNDDASRTFELNLHCAKLQLLSHIFRGRARHETEPHSQVDHLEQQALDAASSILECVSSSQAQTWIQTLPSYFETIIAFACLFTVKTVKREGPRVDEDRIETCKHLLQGAAIALRHSHTAITIAQQLHDLIGLTEMATHSTEVALDKPHNDSRPSLDFDFDHLIDADFDWNLPGFDDLWACHHASEMQLDII